MKLINKKTGEIAEIKLKLNKSLPDAIRRTIEEAGWEETREPLIKHEKVRKAVKAWAEANGDDCYYIVSDYRIDDGSGYSIEFCNSPFEDLENRHYTIRELCGDD